MMRPDQASCIRFFGRFVEQSWTHQSVWYVDVPLPVERPLNMKRKILVLDLDETLIHSKNDGCNPRKEPTGTPDFVFRIFCKGRVKRVFVHYRPHVEDFLMVVSQWFELVIYTAGSEDYAAPVIDRLDDGRGIFSQRFYRQHCVPDGFDRTKDLTAVHRDLSSIFIIDNSPSAYKNFKQNAIPIESWYDDPNDTALLDLVPLLDSLRSADDLTAPPPLFIIKCKQWPYENLTFTLRFPTQASICPTIVPAPLFIAEEYAERSHRMLKFNETDVSNINDMSGNYNQQ
ncbi:hypothetical protein QR680_000556 [Steinernema hermaphroditum]|uniref:FCP1 homology domain-containing protein n=1 Tax=Steinernema hermaphroditum TaxID=289476 RepID=A0AA39GV12_9BILA|nr:hypothetical protein QR680_000556 [Steinernema hermaphroditum]